MNDNRIIKAENVFKAIEKQGYYYILTEKYYGEDYLGPKYIIATDASDFKERHPKLAKMTIVSVEKFLIMADTINESLLNDEREVRRWERHHNAEGYYEEISDTDEDRAAPLKIKDVSMDPVGDAVEADITRERLMSAMSQLKETPRRRLYLYFFECLTYREIAEKEGISDMSLRESINGAIKKLKKFL